MRWIYPIGWRWRAGRIEAWQMLVGGTCRSRGSRQYTFRIQNAGIISALKWWKYGYDKVWTTGFFMIDRIWMWLLNSRSETEHGLWPSEPWFGHILIKYTLNCVYILQCFVSSLTLTPVIQKRFWCFNIGLCLFQDPFNYTALCFHSASKSI